MNEQTQGPDTHVPPAYKNNYYVDHGKAHDDIVRCADCQRLLTCARINACGGCPKCGSRRVKEIRTLSVWEWLQVKLGLIKMEHRDEFLREFSRR